MLNIVLQFVGAILIIYIVIKNVTKTYKNQYIKYTPYANIFFLQLLAFTDVYVRIFWLSYSDTSLEFTREIGEEKFEFKDVIYT